MLVKILLAPLLLLQGIHVRQNIIRLPEPDGPRDGVTGQGTPLKLLILGDSAAAGVGVKEQKDALSGQLVSCLRDQFNVSWTLIARTGENTDSIQAMLAERNELKEFDVIVISLGVNDVTSGKSRSTYIKHTRALISTLKRSFKPQHIVFSGLPPMGYFPSLPQPLRWYLGRQSKKFDQALADLARCSSCLYLSQDKAPDPELIAEDGFHPGAQHYKEWATGIAGMITKRFG